MFSQITSSLVKIFKRISRKLSYCTRIILYEFKEIVGSRSFLIEKKLGIKAKSTQTFKQIVSELI